MNRSLIENTVYDTMVESMGEGKVHVYLLQGAYRVGVPSLGFCFLEDPFLPEFVRATAESDLTEF